mmetsp:Transcript_10496/g.64274  ORF Transcript_10496/g.64274 Transcript_10496/m.64274 type:complete len:204 (+) Transcript_10496:6656-7267(+)
MEMVGLQHHTHTVGGGFVPCTTRFSSPSPFSSLHQWEARIDPPPFFLPSDWWKHVRRGRRCHGVNRVVLTTNFAVENARHATYSRASGLALDVFCDPRTSWHGHGRPTSGRSDGREPGGTVAVGTQPFRHRSVEEDGRRREIGKRRRRAKDTRHPRNHGIPLQASPFRRRRDATVCGDPRKRNARRADENRCFGRSAIPVGKH